MKQFPPFRDAAKCKEFGYLQGTNCTHPASCTFQNRRLVAQQVGMPARWMNSCTSPKVENISKTDGDHYA